MTSTDTADQTRECLGCGRTLRSAAAVARGYGEGCWRKICRAQRAANLSAWTPSQVEKARQAIEDGAVVPSTREGMFQVVSVDGSEVHLGTADHCSCPAGRKTLQGRPCWHRCAIAIITAASAPVPVAAAVHAPIALGAVPVTAPTVDVWAELESLGALAGASAPF